MHINILVRETDLDLTGLEGDWAGVDKGVYLLLKSGIRPKFTYGDFDSVTEEERCFIGEHLEVSPVEPEKDETDLELALFDIASQGYTSVDVFGATGGRVDHLFGNVYMLLHPNLKHLKIRLIDHSNIIQILDEGSHHIYKQNNMEYVSFIPVYEKTILTLEKLKYPLRGHELNIGSTLTISNEFETSEGKVLTSHPIVMIQSKDN